MRFEVFIQGQKVEFLEEKRNVGRKRIFFRIVGTQLLQSYQIMSRLQSQLLIFFILHFAHFKRSKLKKTHLIVILIIK
jgi:hypothetical protein